MESNDLGTFFPLLIAVPFCLFGLVLQAAMCWYLSTCYQAIPPKHRKMEPAMAWLLMIPLFNLVWNFLVFPRLADSYRSFFDEHKPEIDPGTCGRELAFAFAICVALGLVLGWIPCMGGVIALVSLVLLILVLVKAYDLKQRVIYTVGPVTE